MPAVFRGTKIAQKLSLTLVQRRARHGMAAAVCAVQGVLMLCNVSRLI